MEKTKFVNFIITILEESGFKVYRDFKAFQHVIDIYAFLPTIMGDFTLVIACKNYDKEWKVGLDIIKEMEMVGRVLKVSKVAIATTSTFSPQAKNYASEKKIKLLDRENLILLAKKFSGEHYSPDDGKNMNFKNETSQNTDEHNLKSIPKNQIDNEQNNKVLVNLKRTENISQSAKKNQNARPLRLKNKENSNDNPSNTGSSSKILNQINIEKPKEPIGPKIKRILNNSIFLIFLVVASSYLISLLIYQVAKVPVGIQGLVKIFSSLILSYGLVFIINPKGTAVLLKGTIIFFVSLIITILMIIFL